MRKNISLAVVAIFTAALIAGCTSTGAKKQYDQTKQELAGALKTADAQLAKPPYAESSGNWLGATPVELSPLERLPEIFSEPALQLRTPPNTTLTDYARWITANTGVPVSMGLGIGPGGSKSKQSNQSGNTRQSAAAAPMDYQGSLYGLLDTLSATFGTAWSYSNGRILLFRYSTQTWSVVATDTQTNVSVSMSNTGSSSGGGGGSSGGSGGGGTQNSNSQSVQYSATSDFWTSLPKAIEVLLSPGGQVVVNPDVGTITVTDKPYILKQVGDYIKSLNQHMGRQIAIEVRVYNVHVTRQRYFDFGANILFNQLAGNIGGSITPVSGVAAPTGAGEFSLGILATAGGNLGAFAGSTLVARALQNIGRTSLMTSASGVSLNNKPFPIQDTTTTTYLKSVQTSVVSQVGTQTTLEPGTITTGFAMTITPRILNSGKILLSYSVALSNTLAINTISAGSESTGLTQIQAPVVEQRSFMQEAIVPGNSTLVLAGLRRHTTSAQDARGATGFQNDREHNQTAIVITISVRSLKGV